MGGSLLLFEFLPLDAL